MFLIPVIQVDFLISSYVELKFKVIDQISNFKIVQLC